MKKPDLCCINLILLFFKHFIDKGANEVIVNLLFIQKVLHSFGGGFSETIKDAVSENHSEGSNTLVKKCYLQ